MNYLRFSVESCKLSFLNELREVCKDTNTKLSIKDSVDGQVKICIIDTNGVASRFVKGWLSSFNFINTF